MEARDGSEARADILIVDDNERLFGSLAVNFRKRGFAPAWAGNGADAVRMISEKRYAAVLLDLALGEENGLDILPTLLETRPGVPVIIITGYGTFEAAVRAIKLGAHDFLSKPLDIDKLMAILADAVKTGAEAPAADAALGDMVAATPAMAAICEKARLVADSDLPVLITGESGTGKEVLANYIHSQSSRRDRPFLSVNCSAIADSLADSELFGHVKGAYTGAAAGRAGFFEQADGGTLHLDEIGDMAQGIQAKILRALENSRVRRVGDDRDIQVSVRLIASTNKDLEACLRDGTFRRDLYYRLNALHLHLPPLRERREDIPLLLNHFLARAGEGGRDKRFSAQAVEALKAHAWPGNIRELRNLVKICALVTPGKIIEVHDIPQQYAAEQPKPKSIRLSDSEADMIRRALAESGGNKLQAAQLLGISRRTLYNKLERHGLS